jgi:hypothetical protein
MVVNSWTSPNVIRIVSGTITVGTVSCDVADVLVGFAMSVAKVVVDNMAVGEPREVGFWVSGACCIDKGLEVLIGGNYFPCEEFASQGLLFADGFLSFNFKVSDVPFNVIDEVQLDSGEAGEDGEEAAGMACQNCGFICDN